MSHIVHTVTPAAGTPAARNPRAVRSDELRSGELHSTEHGTVLVLFALLLVGLFGLLGAVVDGGRLRVVKQQLDAGAEAAALEGLRFKDREGDVGRRDRATTAMSWQWDDDLDPSNGDVLGLGAGSLPIVDLASSPAPPLGGELNVATAAAARVWKPGQQLEQNLGNEAHGDLVAGTHVPLAPASENDAFQRADYAPTTAGSTASELASASSFLVRLRRATARLPLDRQPGESSSGPAFEWLWARGSAWQEPGPAGTNQSRSTGLTVRTASIATTARALVVSVPPDAGGPALARFALRGDSASAWHATVPGTVLTLDLDPTGGLSLGGVEQGVALLDTARLVGSALSPAPAAPSNVPATALVISVYASIGGERRVIGFTLATASIAGPSLTVTRRPAAVLPASASRISPAALDAQVALDLDPALRALHASFAEPVLAPVIRR